MSVIRFINDKNRTADRLHKVIEYVTRKGTISSDLQDGIGLYSTKPFDEMKVLKKMFHAEVGKQYQHLVISNTALLKDATVAHQVAMRIAGFYGENYQVLVCTHTDTGNLHSHLVINTVNVLTGKRLSQNRHDLQKLKDFANGIFAEYGLPFIGDKDFFFIECRDGDFDDFDDFYDDLEKESKELEEKYQIIRPIKFLDYEVEARELRDLEIRMESYRKGGML